MSNDRGQEAKYFSDTEDKRSNYHQQAKRRKSLGAASQKEKEELNRSRRSSKSRLREEDLPENYAELAKRVYAMAAKEGWTQEKVF